MGFTVKLDIQFLDIEKRADCVHVGNGVTNFDLNSTRWDSMSGNLKDFLDKKSLTLPSSSVTLIFTSNGAGRFDGFSIECTSYFSASSPTSKCGIEKKKSFLV